MTHANRSRGFTLLELLVVISIIAILVGLTTASFSTAQRKARDSKRRGDVKAMQNAFEQYYSGNNGTYGASCATMTSVGGSTLLPNGLPKDPKTGLDYNCTVTAATNSYCVCSTLEGGGGNATNTSCAMGTGSNYCLTNLQ